MVSEGNRFSACWVGFGLALRAITLTPEKGIGNTMGIHGDYV